MSKFLGREEILKVQDIAIEQVEVPEWGGHVYVKGLTAAERAELVDAMSNKRGKDTVINTKSMREMLAASTVCDKEGKLQFSKSDIKALGKKAAAPMEDIFKVASRLSGLGEDEVEELTEALDENPLEGSVSD